MATLSKSGAYRPPRPKGSGGFLVMDLKAYKDRVRDLRRDSAGYGDARMMDDLIDEIERLGSDRRAEEAAAAESMRRRVVSTIENATDSIAGAEDNSWVGQGRAGIARYLSATVVESIECLALIDAP